MAEKRSWIGAACLTIGALPLRLFDPAITWWFPSCPFRALTGLLCPLCGGLRAIHELLIGSPAAAFALNPLVVTVMVIGALAFIHDLVRPRQPEQLHRFTRLIFRMPGLLLVGGFSVLRNLSIPIGWLAH